MVTNIECDPLPNDTKNQDVYPNVNVGLLGCWVDPAITKIVQIGVVHSRVPDVRSYLAAGQERE